MHQLRLVVVAVGASLAVAIALPSLDSTVPAGARDQPSDAHDRPPSSEVRAISAMRAAMFASSPSALRSPASTSARATAQAGVPVNLKRNRVRFGHKSDLPVFRIGVKVPREGLKQSLVLHGTLPFPENRGFDIVK